MSRPEHGPLLVALDVDGTLVTYDDVLSPAVREGVRAVHEAGHHVVISTGRSVLATDDIIGRLGLDRVWAVASNGAVRAWFDAQLPPPGWRLDEQVRFDARDIITSLVAEVPGLLFAVEDVGEGFRLNAPFPDGELTGKRTVVDLEELYAEPISRLVVRSPEHTPADFHDLVARLGLHDVTYAIGWTAWMDIAPEGVTKASGLETIRTELGVPPEATVAVGDGHNDIEMLRWASRGVAMGHADATVRGAADEVTGTIEDDGVLAVLQSVLDGATRPA